MLVQGCNLSCLKQQTHLSIKACTPGYLHHLQLPSLPPSLSVQDADGQPVMGPTSCSREESVSAQGGITAPSPPLTSHQGISVTIDLKVRHLSTLFKSSLLEGEVIGCKAMPHLPTIFFSPGFIKYLPENPPPPGVAQSLFRPTITQWQGTRE